MDFLFINTKFILRLLHSLYREKKHPSLPLPHGHYPKSHSYPYGLFSWVFPLLSDDNNPARAFSFSIFHTAPYP